MTHAEIWLAAYGVVSAITLALYGWDKRAAIRNGRRIPEARLHALALLGGFPGAFLGMHLFRHKMRKPSFHVVVVLAAVLHAGVWVAVLR